MIGSGDIVSMPVWQYLYTRERVVVNSRISFLPVLEVKFNPQLRPQLSEPTTCVLTRRNGVPGPGF